MRVTATFEVTGWEQAAVDEPAEGLPRSRATVTKTFTGEVEATSSAELLMCGQVAYTAQERVVGQVGGRVGSFLIQHGAVTGDASDAEGRPVAGGVVVPGSGTGELTGIAGTVAYRHDETGAVFTLDYELGEGGADGVPAQAAT